MFESSPSLLAIVPHFAPPALLFVPLGTYFGPLSVLVFFPAPSYTAPAPAFSTASFSSLSKVPIYRVPNYFPRTLKVLVASLVTRSDR